MHEPFDLPVVYKNETLHLPAQLKQTGYSHVFAVEVAGQEILFEPDEEGAYRALVKPEDQNLRLDPGLLQAIAAGIESVLR